ncbi:MAG: carboxyltransferase domain-containing protein [Solirubrobacteraceae bacterium]|nr:carboxyltransferase domain-containing protein [Patulibacter sp.]
MTLAREAVRTVIEEATTDSGGQDAPSTWSPGTSAGSDMALGYGAALAELLRLVEIRRPGLLTTVQDLPGRTGLWEVGVPPSGPMDGAALARANHLVGNAAGAAGLEATLEGPSFVIPGGGVIAVSGAEAPVHVGGREVPRDTAITVEAGELVDIGWADRGARIYVAVRGGLAVPEYLGSRSTFIAGRFGGFDGRPLRADDRIAIGPVGEHPVPTGGTIAPAASIPTDHWTLHVLHGPHGAPDILAPEGLETMLSATWTVGTMADRTGVRLEGASPAWARDSGGDAGLDPSNVTETPYALGAIMVSGDTPIIVGPDGPSLGGFAAPLCVAMEDRWKIGQLRPGDRVRLAPVGEPATVDDDAIPPTIDDAASPASPSRTPLPPAIIAAFDAPAGDPLAPAVRYRRAGDQDLVVEYGDPVTDLALRFRIHVLQAALLDADVPGVLDTTPGMRCMQIRFDPRRLDHDDLIAALQALERDLPPASDLVVPSREVVMPLCWEHPGVVEAMRRYAAQVRPDAPWCPDNIEFIRRINGLDGVAEVQRTILDASYCVIGLGDVYLGAPVALPLDPRHQLVTTKYTPPRGWTPENAVGIGGSFLCIYGMEGPGGYQLFGRTVQVWNRSAQAGRIARPGAVEGEPPWLLRHFDRIRFELVDEAQLARLRDASAAGRSVVSITDGTLRLADRLALEQANAAEIAALRAERAAAFDDERRRWAT